MSENNNKLQSFLENIKYSDFFIKNTITDKLIKAHKVVIASASKFVDEVFDQVNDFPLALSESQEGKQFEIVPIPPVINSINDNNDKNKLESDSYLDIIIKYCYANQNFDSIEKSITENNVYALLRYATSFKIVLLTEELSKYISNKGLLNIENCGKTLNEALMLENESLITECLKLIIDHFQIVLNNKVEKESLLNLPFDIFKKITSDDNIIVENEKQVCDLILDYIKIRRESKEFEEKEIIASEKQIKAEVVNIDQNIEDNKQNEEPVALEKEAVKEPAQNEVNEAKVEENPINNNKENVYTKYENKIKHLQNKLKQVKLDQEQERELILCIRFSYLTHKELIGLNLIEELKNHKDLIIQGVSIRLNPYESIDQNSYNINLITRKYIQKNTQVEEVKNEKAEVDKPSNKQEETNKFMGSKFNQFNPVKSYEDYNLNNNFNFNQSLGKLNQTNQQSYQPIQQPQQLYNNTISSNFNYGNNHVQQSNEHPFKPPQNIYDTFPNKKTNEEINFIYENDFDENGVIYYLGTEGGIKPFKNPHDIGQVRIFASSIGKGKLSDLVNRELVNLRTLNEPQSYFGIDFGEDRKLIPSCYSIMNRASSSHVMLCWQLEASNDRINYEVLDTRIFLTNDMQINSELEKERNMLKEPGCTSTWGIDPRFKEKFQQGFRYFIIKHIGRNSSGAYNMAISGFELYGKGMGKGWYFY